MNSSTAQSSLSTLRSVGAEVRKQRHLTAKAENLDMASNRSEAFVHGNFACLHVKQGSQAAVAPELGYA